MNYRPLGKTGPNVSEEGMGTWQFAGNPWGWDAPDEKESMRALCWERNFYPDVDPTLTDTGYIEA